MWGVSHTYAEERDVILGVADIDIFLPYLIKGAIKLEAAGANFIVLPCNSLHIFIEEIRRSVEIPVLSIIDETVSHLRKKSYRNVALFGTESIIGNRLYQDKLAEVSIQSSITNNKTQQKLNHLIARFALSEYDQKDCMTLKNIVDEMILKQNVDGVLLACTDLQVALPKEYHAKTIDTMRILAQAAVNYAQQLTVAAK